MEPLRRRFLALADENRLRTLLILHEAGELCLCHLEQLLDIAASSASRHLGLLRDAGLVESRKDGRWVYFRPASGEGALWLEWLAGRPEALAVLPAIREKVAEFKRANGEGSCPN